jgi:phenylacetate-CoA ligase
MRAVVVALAGHGGRLRELVIAPPQGTLVAVREYHRTHLLAALADRAPAFVVSLDQPVAALVAAINARAPEVVGSFGRMIGHVFREAHARGLPIHRPRLVRYGGEPIAEADRRLIEEHYGVPVLSSYQSCEFLRIAHQCERRRGFHLYSDQTVVRAVDDTGCDVAPGEPGEAVVSNLVNRATVLINYRLRDRIVLGAAPCPCGRTTPVIAAIDGRSDDMLVAADGEAVHESIVLRRLYGVPGLVRIAVTQFAVDRVEARIVVADGTDRAAIVEAIRAALTHLLRHPDARGVAVEVVANLPAGPGGKFRALVSHCLDQSSASMTFIAARA